ncbi:MAG TPA: aldehyde dehydrogenase family protein, partial [Actinoplanes sp.]|nr:aldehyde dehydrogenase family protein [Actinoplanes sp.]
MPETRSLLIGGEQLAASDGRTADDLNPHTGEVFARVAAASPSDVAKAVTAASDAFPAWSTTPPTQRRRILNRAADLLEERGEAAAALMAQETGGTFGWSLFNVGLASSMFREAAALVTSPLGEVIAGDNPDALSLAIRQPAGVVAAFAPWNAPIILGARAVAAPLAVGNTVVVKASEDAPLACALFLAEVLTDAGLPPGVLNVLTNDRRDAAAVAEALISDRRVRRVNFTGSTGVGRRIGELAARHLTPAVLELGGKNSVLVLEDADLEYAVNAVAFAAYMNSGQICMSA